MRSTAAVAEKAEKVLYAFDTSGSTVGSAFYFDIALKLLDGVEEASCTCVSWNSSAEALPMGRMRELALQRKGTGGTQMESLAALLVRLRFHGRLVLVTDGQVPHSSVVQTDQLLTGHAFTSVACHLINTSGPNATLDLSVASPFIRSTAFEIHEHTHPGQLVPVTLGVSSSPVDLDGIDSVEDFDRRYDDLHALILAQNLGRLNPALRDALLAMRRRLLARLKSTSDSAGWGVDAAAAALEARDYDGAKAALLGLVDRYFSADTTAAFTAKVDVLLRLCTSQGQYSSALLHKTSLLARAPMVAADDADAPAAPPDQACFGNECPIMMAEDVPVLLVAADGPPLLEGLDKPALDAIGANPLAVLRYPALAAALLARIDCAVGHAFYAEVSAQAAGGDAVLSPFSRRPILGTVALGNNAGCVAATSWTLAHLTTGGKLLGNAQLWYLLVWHLVRRSARWSTPEHAALLDNMTAHLAWRATAPQLTCKLGLSGLPEQVLVNAPLKVALFYCAKSTDWFADPPDPTRLRLDRMRELWPLAAPMLAALTALGVDYGAAFTAQRLAQIRIFSALMHSPPLSVRLGEALRAQHQNAMYLPGAKRFVFLDGAPTPAAAAEAADILARLVGGPPAVRAPAAAAVAAAAAAGAALTAAAAAEEEALADGVGAPAPGLVGGLQLSTLSRLLALASANANVKAGAVVIPRPLESELSAAAGVAAAAAAATSPAPAVVVNYSNQENAYGAGGAIEACQAPVSPLTLRPFYAVGDATWREAAEAKYGPLDKQLSMEARYSAFIISKGLFPEDESEEFALFCARGQLNKHGYTTLPSSYRLMYAATCREFAVAYAQRAAATAVAAGSASAAAGVVGSGEVGERPPIAEVIAVLKASMPVKARRLMEIPTAATATAAAAAAAAAAVVAV